MQGRVCLSVASGTLFRTVSTVTTHRHLNKEPHVVSAILSEKTCGGVARFARINVIDGIGFK